MSDDAELSISELRRKRAQSNANSASSAPRPEERTLEPTIIETVPRSPVVRMQQPPGPPPDSEEKLDLPFDPWRLPEALRLRWHWLVLAAFALGLLGGTAGYWRGKYAIHVTLTLRDLSARFIASQEGESYKPPQLSSQTLVNFLTSPELISYVSANANPPISEKRIISDLTVKQDRDSETINIMLMGKNPTNLVDLANLYTRAAVEVSKEAQMENPSLMYTNFTMKLEEIKTNEYALEAKLTSLRTNAGVIDPELENPAFEKERVDLLVKIDMARSELEMLDAKSQLIQNGPVQKRLQDAEDRLKVLQEKGLLDEHPAVKGVKAEIERLKQQLAGAAGTDSSDPLEDARKKDLKVEIDELQRQSDELKMKVDKLYEHAGEYNQVTAELNFLEKVQKTLEDRLFEAQQYHDNAEGYYKLSPDAELKDVDTHGRIHKAMVYGIAGGFAGFMAAMMVILFTEVIDPRMKTAADVRRVTQLPVLATLGNLNKMNDEARKAWAFRTWTILSGTLSPSANYGTVCGIISCAHGEGRSTWVELLVTAARERGFEVTKLDFGRADKNPPASASAGDPPAAAEPATPAPENQGEPAAPATDSPPFKEPSALKVRETNSAVAQANYASVIHIQLPGLVWNLERRIQFQEELDKWRAISRAVVLIDLPPASVPEAILLAENLPQVLWLVDSGKSHARETRLHLETLRHARCKLVGAVLNHEPEPLIKL